MHMLNFLSSRIGRAFLVLDHKETAPLVGETGNALFACFIVF